MIPQTRSFIGTFAQLISDFDRRLLIQERRPQRGLVITGSTLAVVGTTAEVTDLAVWYYVTETDMVWHGGTSMTYDAWLAGL